MIVTPQTVHSQGLRYDLQQLVRSAEHTAQLSCGSSSLPVLRPRRAVLPARPRVPSRSRRDSPGGAPGNARPGAPGTETGSGALEIWPVTDQFMLQTFLLSVQTERIRWGDYYSIERKHTNSNTSTYANIPLSPVFSSGTYRTDTDGPVSRCVSPPAHCVLPKSGQFLRCLIQLLPTRHSIENN